jgi:hypothetical protein
MRDLAFEDPLLQIAEHLHAQSCQERLLGNSALRAETSLLGSGRLLPSSTKRLIKPVTSPSESPIASRKRLREALCVPKTHPGSSRDEPVLVDEAAEDVCSS